MTNSPSNSEKHQPVLPNAPRDHWLFTSSLFKTEWCDSLLHRLSFAISSFLWGKWATCGELQSSSPRGWVGRYEHVPWACWKGAGFGVVIRMWRKEGMGDPLGLTSGLANTLPDAQASPSTYSYLSFSTCKREQWYWSHLWSALRFTKKNALDGYYSHLST